MDSWLTRTHALDVEDFEAMARSHGALAPDEKMSPELHAFIVAVVEQCACIADTYSKDDDENAGDHIRSPVLAEPQALAMGMSANRVVY